MTKERVYLFGAGKKCREMLPILKEQYNIIGIVDNNIDRWNSEFEGLHILEPKKIWGVSEKILITTSWGYFDEIRRQLQKSGIADELIVLAEFSSRENKIHLFPNKQEGAVTSYKDLVDYDLLGGKKDSGEGVLLLCGFYTVYVINLINNIKKRNKDYSISLLTNSLGFKENLREKADHIYYYETNLELDDILEKLPEYNVFQTLWIESIWAMHYQKIRKKCKRLNLFVGGSDLYRAGDKKLKLKKRLIDVSDIIGIETEAIRDDFLKVFPEMRDRVVLFRYGIEYIEQEKFLRPKEVIYKRWGFSSEKLIITCAHNAVPEQQHEKIISALSRMPQNIRDAAVYVFPMTYGNSDESYVDHVETMLKDTGMDYRIIRDFMPYLELAEYISISSIYINVQTTDALSTTILEEMYAGAVAVTGTWLPYMGLREKGIDFVAVDTIDDLTEIVADIITNYSEYKEKFSRNREIIYEMSSWDNMSKEWLKVWSLKESMR